MSDTDDHDPNDEFWEKVGEYHDPERFFIKCMEKCGATVIKDGDYLEIIGGCNNLVFHTDTMMQEIFCTKCGGSVSVIEVTDIMVKILLTQLTHLIPMKKVTTWTNF